MHLNTQHNKLLHNERSDKNNLNYITTQAATPGRTAIPASTSTYLPIEASAEKIRNTATIGDSFTGTANSCASSTDSGVNISDNEIPRSPSPTPQTLPSSFTTSTPSITTVNPFNQHHYRNNKNTNDDKNNINNFNDFDDDVVVQTSYNSKNVDKKLKSEESQYREQPQSFDKAYSSSNESNCTPYQTNNLNVIKSENVINFNHHPKTQAATTSKSNSMSIQHNAFSDPRPGSTSPSLSMSSTNSFTHPPSKMHNRGSPAVSIRSIDSSVIDSDSDSDMNGEIEGVHENYVIKKLGTQVSYPPRHPDIPNINRGLTVLNQHVAPHGSHLPPPPNAALSAIGNCLDVAQALGPLPSNSAIAQRPQIGSIALSNSSDVTFGDKHFYEGPVTIQQFLIDGRDKWQESNAKDNPSFESGNIDTPSYAKDINSTAAAQPSKFNVFSSKRKMYIIAGALGVMILLIAAVILATEALNDSKSKIALGNSEESRKNIPINSTIDVNINVEAECDGNNGTLCLIERDVWKGRQQTNDLDKQKLPLHRAIISHTASEPCDSLTTCQERVRVIQEFHMNSLRWDDIGYNFLISSDGRVYVGRGWDPVGAHTKGYNYDSVGITFIGTYMKTKPTGAQLNACRLLLEEGVRLQKLVPNYRLYGARQFSATESPGDMLYKIIRKWDHWSPDINAH